MLHRSLKVTLLLGGDVFMDKRKIVTPERREHLTQIAKDQKDDPEYRKKNAEHMKRIAVLGGKAKPRKSALERFEENIRKDPNTGCWIWVGYMARGYGTFKVNGQKSPIKVSRWAYEYFKKEKIPSTKVFVCHTCDVRACVNPDHLFLGSNQDNMDDAKAKYRFQYGEKHHQSKLTKSQVGEILELRRQDYTLQAIADKYGVTKTSIGRICKGTQRVHNE
jgi:hypothetical protein